MNAPVDTHAMEVAREAATAHATARAHAEAMVPVEARRATLSGMLELVRCEERALAEALTQDMGRGVAEAWTSELITVAGEAAHALKHVARWMKPERAPVPFQLRPARARIEWHPKGTALVIGAWNLPFGVSLCPAIAALAAGNSVVLKPSELAPASAAAMAQLLPRYLPDGSVAVVQGDATLTQALLERRWGHVFYTGGGSVGRLVAEAAGRTLSPVTLELGGKCPAYVHRSANVDVAARRIAWGKFMNAGQVCVAPDYALVDRSVASAFEAALKRAIARFYGGDPRASADYARIVNTAHFDRIAALTDASRGCVIEGGGRKRDERYIAPTIVADVAPDDALMREEIFGPVLPLLSVNGPDDALRAIAELPAPLAAYPFARDKSVVARFERECRTGAVVANDVTVNHAVPSLPFGGVGGSGYGTYHGVHGFRTFSYPKAILRRGTGSDPALRYPPYTQRKLRWLKRLG